jgi:hypothetical protein
MLNRWALLLVIGVSGLAGCTVADDGGLAGGDVAQGTEPVALEVRHRSEWRVLWIEGDTDLPDGALVNYTVTHEAATLTPAEEWPAANLTESARATVNEGQYWARINTLNWPTGQVRVLVQFPLPPQPPEVDTRYGAFGEHLTGANVTVLAGMKAVEVEYELEHHR